MSGRNIGIFVLLTGWLITLPVYADHIVMKNGDKITGKIQEIWDKDIIIEPEYDDDTKVKISLDVVSYIESEREFEIELADGRSVIAKLTGRDTDGKQLIEIDGKRISITLDQLEELDEIVDYYDWDNRIDFNFTLNKGNTDSLNTKFFIETNLKLGDHRQIADLTLTREEQDLVTTRDNTLLRYNYNWLFSDPWFLGGTVSAERDPIRDLNFRLIIGATIGRDLWNKPRRAMSFQVGLGYLTEETSPTDSDGTPLQKDRNQSLAALWLFRFRKDFFGDDLEVYHDNTVQSYVTGRTNTVVKTVTGARYNITDLLYVNLSINFDWEAEPVGTAEGEDLSVVAGLGIEF